MNSSLTRIFAITAAAAFLAGCETAPECPMPTGHNVDAAFSIAEGALMNGCHARFDAYFEKLLTVAEGDPDPGNRKRFSNFLVSASESGLLSKRQAQQYYNRYFNVKFVSLMGDYNNCAYSCPRRTVLISRMEQELADKERGLLRIVEDRDSYYRADRLLKETELVLAATCDACEPSN